MTTVAILPMKPFEQAKQRLAPALGAGHRRALAEAMFSDVLLAIRRTQAIDQTYLITKDRTALRMVGGGDVTVIDDTASSHSEATGLGIARALAEGAARVLLLPGDCPMIDPAELGALLAHPVAERSALIVPDRHGEGTNALLLTPPDSLTPSFGEGSRQRHLDLAIAQGASPQVIDVPSLALDVDTPEDFDVLMATLASTRGGAAHTRGLLTQLARSQAQ